MSFPMITALTAAVLALLQTALMLSVGFMRLSTRIGVGDGGQEPLERRIRRHANLAENAPIFLIVLALLEFGGTSTMILTGIAGGFVIARLAHAYAFTITSGPHPLRPVGALGTVAITLVAAVYLLLLSLGVV